MNPGGKAASFVGQGPRTGNKSLGSKPQDFKSSKAELQGLASEIVREATSKAVQLGTKPNAGGIHANVSGKRGLTKGNG